MVAYRDHRDIETTINTKMAQMYDANWPLPCCWETANFGFSQVCGKLFNDNQRPPVVSALKLFQLGAETEVS